MRLRKLLQGAGYEVPQHVTDMEITGITASSEKVKSGMLFVAISGLHKDGHDYIEQAFSNGAAFAICEKKGLDFPCLAVPNSREAWAKISNAWYENPTKEMCLIGVTGTNGKTSVTAMLYEILRCAGYRCGLIGTVSCLIDGEKVDLLNDDQLANMTTPDPPQLYNVLWQMKMRGVTHVIMEVTSHALALSKVSPLTFERAVFTNLTPDHLDLHGDMEQYFAEKKKLFSMARGAVVSCLFDHGRRLANELTVPTWCLTAENIEKKNLLGVLGSQFELQLRSGEKMAISIPVVGDFMVENAALAALTARSLGVLPKTVTKALRDFGGVRGRMERVGVGSDITVFLDYAHTPDALERVLRALRGLCIVEQRIWVVFGCGGDRDRTKRPEMGRIASRLADYVIVTSDNSRSEPPEQIIAEIMKGIDKEKPYWVVTDRRLAICEAIAQARGGDIVLLAGKGHEDYEICGERRLPFCERDIVLEALKARKENRNANRTV